MSAAVPSERGAAPDAATPRWRQRIAGIAGLLLVTTAAMLVPVARATRELNAVMDLGHLPLFAALAVALRWLFSGWLTRSRLGSNLLAWGTVVVGGAGLEVLQELTGRHASRQDLLADALGAAVGLLWMRRETWRKLAAAAAAFAVGMGALVWAAWEPATVLVDGYRQRREWPVLDTFEDYGEITRWQFESSDGQIIARDNGNRVLRVTFGTSEYSAATYIWPLPDWSAYRWLEFDAELAGSDPLVVVVKLEDLRHNGLHADRYNEPFTLLPGKNRVRISLDDVRRAPHGREFDLRQVMRIQWFTAALPATREVELDDLRLVGSPVEPLAARGALTGRQ